MAEDDSKVFDVAKPGTAKPDIGAKPMIVGHKSMASDPMVREKEEESVRTGSSVVVEKAPESESTVETIGVSVKKKIEPMVEQKNEEVVAETPKEEKAAEEVKPEEEKKEEVENKKEDVKIDPVAEDMEREDSLHKMIESKKYFVHIDKPSGKKIGMRLAIPLILLLLLVAGYLLIDAEVIKTNMKLPFEFFKSSEVTPISPVAEVQQSANDSSNSDTVPEPKEVTWKSMDSEELGISFEYPSTWDPKIALETSSFTKTGKAYSFDLWPQKFGGWAFSDDWIGVEDAAYQGSGSFDGCSVDNVDSEVDYLSTDNSCIKAFGTTTAKDSYGYGGSTGNIELQVKISNSKGEFVLMILQAPIGSQKDKPFTEDMLKGFYDETAADLKRFVESIKNL